MSDSTVSTTEVEIVDINQYINENMQIVINDNVNDNDAIQLIHMLEKEKEKKIKEGKSDKKEIKSEAEGEEERRNINIIRDHVAENFTVCNIWRFRGCFIFFLLVCVTVFFGTVLILKSNNMHGPFALLSRPWVWSFLVITIFYICILIL